MSKTVEFFFDFVSPATYLAFTQLPKIAARTDAEIAYKPFLLGGVLKAAGNQTPMSVPAKAAWMLKDLERFAKRYRVDLTFNPHFPFRTIELMRGAIWAQEINKLAVYSETMFKAIWADALNVGDESVVRELLTSIKLDPAEFQEAISKQDIKDKLRANTDDAVNRGAFGAPTFFVEDEMFWGQDRLDFVEEALKSR